MKKSGTRAVTISDIARIANVSKKTVSRVINKSASVSQETRLKVEAAIAHAGFTPNQQARALAFQKSFLVAMIYDNPNPQYVVNIQRGILDVLAETEYQLVLQPYDRSDGEYYDRVENFMRLYKPSGVVLTPSISEDDKLAKMLQSFSSNYIRIASVDIDTPQRMVRTHERHGGRLAAIHLAKLGHTNIGHIKGPTTFRSATERWLGFKEGLAEFNIELDERLVKTGAYNFDSGVACAAELLDMENPPTAIFAGNDEMAVGVYFAARQAGISVPDQLSVVGFDDTPISARVWPSLTTVQSPIREIGRAAARRIAGLEKDASSPIEFEVNFIERASSCAPNR